MKRSRPVGLIAAAAVLLLVGCAPTAETPQPDPDPREQAIAILEGAVKSGSPGATDEQLADAVDRAVAGLEELCAVAAEGKDPHATVQMDAETFDLVTGAEKVLQNNNIDVCEAFGD